VHLVGFVEVEDSSRAAMRKTGLKKGERFRWRGAKNGGNGTLRGGGESRREIKGTGQRVVWEQKTDERGGWDNNTQNKVNYGTRTN